MKFKIIVFDLGKYKRKKKSNVCMGGRNWQIFSINFEIQFFHKNCAPKLTLSSFFLTKRWKLTSNSTIKVKTWKYSNQMQPKIIMSRIQFSFDYV